MRSIGGLRLFRPCMGFYLQGSVKALAVVEIGVQLTVIIIILYNDITLVDERLMSQDRGTGNFCVFIASWTYCYVYKLVSIVLAIQLYIDASKRRRSGLLRWLIIATVMFIGMFAFIIINDGLGVGNLWVPIAAFCAFAVYKVYSFWVVYSFIQEIQRNGSIDSTLNVLSDAELDEFFNGSNMKNTFEGTPYEKDFEIPVSDLVIDKTNPLGSGEFGVVYKANLSRNIESGEEGVQTQSQIVAVKTAHQKYFKCLLRELQVLNYIGRHNNIVNLIGACTTNLKKSLFVVVEFCGHGSLLSYIRRNREALLLELQPQSSVVSSDYICDASDLKCCDLIRWAMEIASGMEYIAEKNVIHGDLAARNVLLSLNRTAKIADFGLSKQLYRYTIYKKKGDVPLPWCWMAPESLADLTFSSCSDVWSYGITSWEIFSCGGAPYSGLNNTTEVVEQIKSGILKPSCPPYSTMAIYDVICKCWEIDPNARPTFTELKIFFENILNGHELQSYLPLCMVQECSAEYITVDVENYDCVD